MILKNRNRYEKKDLTKMLVEDMVRDSEFKEAAIWIEYLKLDESSLDIPTQVAEHLTTIRSNGGKVSPDAEMHESESYHCLPENVSIIFVDNQNEFARMTDDLQNEYLIGLDCEFSGQKVALMQISCESKVFLLDLENFPPDESEPWLKFFDTVFSETSINRIFGFDFRNDIKVLHETSSAFKDFSSRLR